ncbi:hypothetical protein [Enterococcus sp. AZ109]|uniref:hypothetical protein n=1 Tax=Enterococcus sp. AZ109 TaxID=2774634 RepID=UPI003F1E9F23
MDFNYQQDNAQTQVIYGETVASMMREKNLANHQIIICGNQRYYDLYADKLAQFIPKSSNHDWFITTNNHYCNDINHFEDFIFFLRRFSQHENFLFIGIGNEGVMELTAFSHHVSNLTADLWLLPVSIRAFAQSLTFQRQIVLAETIQPVMEIVESPDKILFDHTMADQQSDGKMVDLLSLLRCGIVSDHSFLQQLYSNYPTRQLLMQRSFSAFIEPMLMHYQENGKAIKQFGKSFELAFFQTENGHLLSNSMRSMFGLLLELCWNVCVRGLHFNFKNFVIWLGQLGYPLNLPEPISLGDYGQQVIALTKERPLVALESVGKIGEPFVPTQKELIQTFEEYQKIIEEIRGT